MVARLPNDGTTPLRDGTYRRNASKQATVFCKALLKQINRNERLSAQEARLRRQVSRQEDPRRVYGTDQADRIIDETARMGRIEELSTELQGLLPSNSIGDELRSHLNRCLGYLNDACPNGDPDVRYIFREAAEGLARTRSHRLGSTNKVYAKLCLQVVEIFPDCDPRTPSFVVSTRDRYLSYFSGPSWQVHQGNTRQASHCRQSRLFRVYQFPYARRTWQSISPSLKPPLSI